MRDIIEEYRIWKDSSYVYGFVMTPVLQSLDFYWLLDGRRAFHLSPYCNNKYFNTHRRKSFIERNCTTDR